MVQNWEVTIDGNPVTPVGNRVTISVRPGDEITWLVANFQHGVVFESQSQMSTFLDIQANQTLANRSGFFGGNGFGTEAHASNTELVRAATKDVADRSQELDFTCFVHGPGLMNGTLRFE